MQVQSILRVLGVLMMLFSLTLVPPILVEYWYQDGSQACFVYSLFFIAGLGGLIWAPFRHHKKELRSRDGFLIVVLFWSVICAIGAIPFYLSVTPNISLTDALFESVSGFTTTGASVLSGLDSMPHALLYYRQQLHFLGGGGIIILAVAILPMLGIGGMQLFRAESSGPVKDNKLTPRIAQTAKALWTIYVFLTLACCILLYLGGMRLFDAVSYAFSIVSTGGFAPYDTSMTTFQSTWIKSITIVFMFLGSVSFNLHFLVFRSKSLQHYMKDEELGAFIKLLGVSILAVCAGFFIFGKTLTGTLILDAVFTVVSLFTTTGLLVTDFSIWPSFIPLLIMFTSVVGGCAGSTTGGLKVIRILLLLKQSSREILRLIHPRAHYSIKLGQTAVSNRVIEAIWGFLGIYFAIFTLFLLLLLLTENDLLTAYSALIACLNNAGAALGGVSSNFSSMSDLNKWILSFAMLVGRLEIFTLLVLFSPAYWKN